MSTPLDSLLSRFSFETAAQSTLALREVTQEIALLGLWRGKFFERASFYGGTSLRIVHGLDRFSEDMDFSLNVPNLSFDLEPYLDYLTRELHAFGFEVSVQPKSKDRWTHIESAFVKMNTRQNLLHIGAPASTVASIAREQVLKVKLEVDVDPPGGFDTEVTFLTRPQSFSVRLFDMPSMFAGKLHAAIARAWKTRVKGRDWYDLVWFVGRDIPVRLGHLKARLVQTGHLDANAVLTAEHVRELLNTKIATLDIEAAREDARAFATNKSALEVWSREFFFDVVRRIRSE